MNWQVLSARWCALAAWLAAFAAPTAHASMFAGEALDTAADILAILVMILVPAVGITAFWLVHVLPEKIAHKRHHPQRDAIQTLCLLSLVFGGMLWPIAWLWAYTKPVGYRMAYGTDKHEDYYAELGDKARAGGLLRDEIEHLRAELDQMATRGGLPPELRKLRDELDALHAAAPAAAPAQPPARKA